MKKQGRFKNLLEFFRTQNNETLAFLCASFIGDLNRFFNLAELSSEEIDELLGRTERNLSQIERFLENPEEYKNVQLINADLFPPPNKH